MPTEKRGSISSVHPTGWHSVKYDNVDGKSLFNRCHLITFCLAGENTNERNLITGTRYMNVQGMLPFENMVADYVKSTRNHVMYRVEPDLRDQTFLPAAYIWRRNPWRIMGQGLNLTYTATMYSPRSGSTMLPATAGWKEKRAGEWQMTTLCQMKFQTCSPI